jgi:excisionase family DNA binding protein
MFNEFTDILTIEDLQEALKIGRTTAYRIINNGKLKHIRIGKAIKIPKQFLIDYVKQECYSDMVEKEGYPSQ